MEAWLGFFFAPRAPTSQAVARPPRQRVDMAGRNGNSGHDWRSIQRPGPEARLRAEAEQRARLEADRAEHARRLAERAARESADAAERAELSQLRDAQRAEFERAEGLARASVELRSQLDSERAARRELESSLTSQLLRQRLLTSVSAALCVGGAVAALGLYFGALQPKAERTLATAERSLHAE